MSKPKPFISSLWGIAFVLILAIVVLGINNYRGNQAGFNIAFSSSIVIPTDKTKANSFQLIDTAEMFAKLCQPTEPVSIDWTKQLALVYFAPAQSTTSHLVKPLSVHRDNTTINIDYQLETPTVDTKTVSGPNYTGVAILLDRARLISSSNLLVNLLQNKTITQSLIITPNQI